MKKLNILTKRKVLILLVFVQFLFISSVFAQQNLPPNLQKIIDYNNQQTLDFSTKVSFFIAFIAGILGILSPCILPFLPAYFSYTFKEKKNITRMTMVFFLGFSLVFVIMGIIVGFLGEQTLLIVQQNWLVTIAGIFMIVLGVLSLKGKKLCSFIDHSKCKDDVPGTFLFGVSFAFGWTACLGPILAGILGIGAILGNMWYSALLLFFYSLGNLVPLFILSMVYDKFDLSKSSIIKGRMFIFSIMGKKYYIHSTNIISGLLFLAFGTFLIIYKGTGPVNTLDIFGTRSYFYSLQNSLIGWEYANVLGVILLFLFILIIGKFLWRRKSKKVTIE